MEKEKQIGFNTDSSPNQAEFCMTFAVMLCIFFCLLFRTTIGAVPQLINEIIPQIATAEHTLGVATFYFANLAFIILGFWSVILALKSSKYAIRCLKLTLPFNCFSFILGALPKVPGLSIFGLPLPLLLVGFYFIFFIYICKSKQIKEDFPIPSRRWGVPGIMGIVLYIMLLSSLLFTGVESIINGNKGKKIDVSSLRLNPGEVSDGWAIFTPMDTWILDSLSTPNTISDIYCYHDIQGEKLINVGCCKEEYEPSRHFYIYSIYENQPLPMSGFQEELNYAKNETESEIIYVDQYSYKNDSSYVYWTYASRIQKKTMKSIRLSIVEQDTLSTSILDAIHYLESIQLDLSDRLLEKD